MSKKLTVILGAGFSANANMPTAGKIAEYFDRNLKEELICFSSSEWAWKDGKSETNIHNGRLNFDWLAYSYVFNELVKSYKIEKGDFINYEDFYQFIIDNTNDIKWVGNLFQKAKNDLLHDRAYLTEDNGYNSNYLFPFDKEQFSKIQDILNYLINDLLWKIPIDNDELIEIYAPFINYLQAFEEVDIFTLNHDLLLERLLNLFGIEYTKGFNTENSSIKHNDKNLPVFKGQFNKRVRIYKLHGSIDLYKFNHFDLNGGFWQPNGDYDYYLTTNYSEKHNANRVNPNTGEILQDYNFDIVPKFITGTNKTEMIQNDKMYKELFMQYEKVINEAENLFISGYSFCDEHINQSLEKNKNIAFINHNRSKDYPFSENGKNVRTFEEL